MGNSPKSIAATTGTSADVLQHYLTASITCRVIADSYADTQGKLVGLDLSKAFPVRLNDGSGTGSVAVRFADCLPELYSFGVLCTPLSDGTGRVPVIEMVKALTYYPDPSEDSEAAQPNWKLAHAYYEDGKIEVFWDEHEPGEDGEDYTGQFTMDADYWSGCWHSEDGLVPAGPAMIDWLRANHFAAPVNGRPLNPGRDYLPK